MNFDDTMPKEFSPDLFVAIPSLNPSDGNVPK